MRILIASERVTPCCVAQRSTRAMYALDRRKPIIGRTPVAGRPRFFCLADNLLSFADIDFRMNLCLALNTLMVEGTSYLVFISSLKSA
jgi:hypothetical protein